MDNKITFTGRAEGITGTIIFEVNKADTIVRVGLSIKAGEEGEHNTGVEMKLEDAIKFCEDVARVHKEIILKT